MSNLQNFTSEFCISHIALVINVPMGSEDLYSSVGIPRSIATPTQNGTSGRSFSVPELSGMSSCTSVFVPFVPNQHEVSNFQVIRQWNVKLQVYTCDL